MKPSGVRTTPFSSRARWRSPGALSGASSLAAKLPASLQDLVDQVRARRLVARQPGEPLEIGDVLEHEAHVVERRR